MRNGEAELFVDWPREKRCPRCRVAKPLNEYHRSSARPDSVDFYCKKCKSESDGCKRHLVVPTVNVSLESVIYLAGLIDGEGTIGIARTRNGKNKRGYGYSVRVLVGMTDPVVCSLRDEFGIGLVRVRQQNPQHKPCFLWNIGSNHCRALLPLVIPYLRVKRRQAKLVQRYLNLAAHRTNRIDSLRNRHWRIADSIYARLRELNRRGV